MNVEIGAEAAQFPENEYINGIAVAVWVYSYIVVKFLSRKCGRDWLNCSFSQILFLF